ncbi:MAG: hypothetical protein MJ089_06435 [Ruminococcus sp.]|nr:hypothetical protein [Ruminococcus sp.]
MPDTIQSVSKESYIHFSIDVVNTLFEDLTNNQSKYNSIFEQPILSFAQKLHEKYGTVFSFYVFYSWDVNSGLFSLADATDKYAKEFSDNAEWLKFGFYAKDAKSYNHTNVSEVIDYYHKTLIEIKRITGSDKSIDEFIRLDRYSADEKVVKELIKVGVKGLLITEPNDESRICYNLTDGQQKVCFEEDWYCNEGMYYTPTDIRLENINSDDDFYSLLNDVYMQKRIIIFTHEIYLDDFSKVENEQVMKYMTWLAEFAYETNMRFDYLQNEVNLYVQ